MSHPQDPNQQPPQGHRPPGAPGTPSQGQRPPGAPGTLSQGQRPPGAPGQYPQGQRPPGAPGQYPQGQRPPGAPGQHPQGQRPPGGAQLKQKAPSKMLYWFAICSFVFGVVSLGLWFLWFVPFFNLGYAIVAFLLGISAIRRNGEYKGLAAVGVITATITLLIIALFTVNKFLPNPIPFAETMMEFFTRNETFS